MDYVVGGVAALVTGNVTPNRPRLMKRALTPTKHQPSPNVTPKSEFVEDRSIFLSPSMQKKKAIVKKSPKRIFENPDLETTDNGDGNASLTSPKADKVKKHLKDELESTAGAPKSPKKKNKTKNESISSEINSSNISEIATNESTPKKKKKKNNSVTEDLETTKQSETVAESTPGVGKSPKKIKQRHKSIIEQDNNKENNSTDVETAPVTPKIVDKSPKKQKSAANTSENETDKQATPETITNLSPKKKNKKRKKKQKPNTQEKSESTENIAEETNKENVENAPATPKKKNKKRKKSKAQQNKPEPMSTDQTSDIEEEDRINVKQSKKSKATVNPNAITDKESDSEHESDDEIESENEEINKKVFESQPNVDESSDDEDGEKKEEPKKQKKEKPKEEGTEKSEVMSEDEIKRTLFVGNVPFSAKCKKEIKKIFNKHGQIETIRIRTVPVKDGRYTPKLAVIKNELHPERTTVNVYIKYADADSVEKALAENNTVLNDYHLRVSRSSHTGAEHDPKCSIFVGNLPFAMEDEVLREKFEKCGEIESVRIIRDKKTNAGKGFGYVNFASKDGVELALALTEEDLTIKNRIIRVKRCTQLTNKQKQNDKSGFKKQFNQRPNQGNQKVQGGNPRLQGGNQRSQGGNQRSQGGNQRSQGVNQRGNQRFQGGNQGGPRGPRPGNKDEDGAFRRIMNKRKFQEGNTGEGPPNKKQKNINQPNKEKKSHKEFVGMTAEKKKKRKFDKGQKKKKALSEILTK